MIVPRVYNQLDETYIIAVQGPIIIPSWVYKGKVWDYRWLFLFYSVSHLALAEHLAPFLQPGVHAVAMFLLNRLWGLGILQVSCLFIGVQGCHNQLMVPAPTHCTYILTQ